MLAQNITNLYPECTCSKCWPG